MMDITKEKLISELKKQLKDVVIKDMAIVAISLNQKDDIDEQISGQLILEDCLRVSNFGWPQGFDFEILTTD